MLHETFLCKKIGLVWFGFFFILIVSLYKAESDTALTMSSRFLALKLAFCYFNAVFH